MAKRQSGHIINMEIFKIFGVTMNMLHVILTNIFSYVAKNVKNVINA